jgi:hypothetical protein
MKSTALDSKKGAPSEAGLNESLDGLSIELGRISAEILSINSSFQAQMQQALADLQENLDMQYKERLNKALDQMREKAGAEARESLGQELKKDLAGKQVGQFDKAKKEIARIGKQMEDIEKDIAGMLDDPNIELAKVIRKRSELVELKAYLNGLRFVTQ